MALRQPQKNKYLLGSPPQSIRDGDFSSYIPYADGQIFKIYDPLTTRANPAGGFLRDQFPGNVVPANRMDRVGSKVVTYFPNPNTPGAACTVSVVLPLTLPEVAVIVLVPAAIPVASPAELIVAAAGDDELHVT